MHTKPMQRFFPFLAWPRPDRALWRTEAMAGLVVGLMVVPQGVAYAVLAGMPPVTGIYAAMLPTLVAALFSASARLSVGPTALTCLLVFASLSDLAVPGSPEWVNLALCLSLLAGGLQLILGWVGFGWLLNVVSAPVLLAFTQAAACLIIASQSPDLIGWSGGWSQPAWHPMAALAGGVSLGLLWLGKRLNPAFPVVLLVVIGGAAWSWATDFGPRGGRVVGALPQGLPHLAWPVWPGWAMVRELLLPTLVITLVSFLETASSAKVDSEGQGKRWNQNQDLMGQGLAKIAAACTGTFPTSSSFSRSALNLYAGAQTGWAAVFSVVVVAVVLWVLTPLLGHVPQAVLAAIVVVAVSGLVKPWAFLRLWAISRTEASIAGVTFVVTLGAAPQLHWGVLAGVLMSLSHFVYERLHPRIIEVGLHPDGSLRDRQLWQLPALAPDTWAFRMDAALDFAAAAAFERAVLDALAQQPGVRHLCWFAQSINRIDATGVETLLRLQAQLQTQQRVLHVSGMKLPVENALLATGAWVPGVSLRLYRTEAETLHALEALRPCPDDIAAAAI